MGLLHWMKNYLTDADENCPLPDQPPREREDAVPENPWDVGRGRVVLLKPVRCVDAGKIADYLCQGYTVLLNLEEATPQAARRIVDFLSGGAYAKDAQMLHIACQVYLLAPIGVDVLDFHADTPPEEEGWEYGAAFGF